jgi:integrase
VITLRDIFSLAPNTTAWDEGKGAVAGFGARRQRSAAVSYVLKYRLADGRQRWHTIGRHGAPWTPDMARAEGRRILGEVAKGGDPSAEKQEARKAATIGELCDGYREAAEAGRILTRRKTTKKPSTLDGDRGRIERHIKPVLGRLKVAAVTSSDIERFRDAVSEGATAARIKTGKRWLARVSSGRGTATRAMGLLGAIFAFAVRRGLRADNPVRGVERHAYEERQRCMTEAEYRALGEALRTMPEAIWPAGVAATRFLALTGWRRGEMLALKWSEIDLAIRTARLADTKTGASLRPLSHAACDVLRSLPRLGALVFPASVGTDKPMRGFHKIWLRIAAEARLPADVTPHVLRHTFASLASDLGYSEPTIAALIGHKGQSMTSRYVHSADAVLLAAADKVADCVSESLGESRGEGSVIPISRGR